ncbi:Retrovirus-related Pol poly from transposon, partial [Brachionus plicatilis]
MNNEQLKDEDIKWMIDLKKTHKDKKPKINIFENPVRQILYKQFDNLVMVEGVLYRHSEDRNGFLVTQFVLPKQVVEHIHSSIFNAHLGRHKTTGKIIERFYRPFLKEEIKNCIKHCDICRKTKSKKNEGLAELLYLTPCRPNQLITTDFAGPFKTTSRGNKYLQIIADHFTKLMLLCPTKDAKAITAGGNVVDEWACEYGIPEAVLSDGAKCFQSKLSDLVYDFLDIRRLKTTPFHPQCDGL